MTNPHHALGTFEHFPVKISSRHSIRLVTAWIANSLEPEKGCCNSQVFASFRRFKRLDTENQGHTSTACCDNGDNKFTRNHWKSSFKFGPKFASSPVRGDIRVIFADIAIEQVLHR